MNADGSGQINLTPKMDSGTGTWSSRAPAWSPNGKYIYFTGVRPGIATEQIYVMGADGSNQTPLTAAGVNAEATVRHVRPPAITQYHGHAERPLAAEQQGGAGIGGCAACRTTATPRQRVESPA